MESPVAIKVCMVKLCFAEKRWSLQKIKITWYQRHLCTNEYIIYIINSHVCLFGCSMLPPKRLGRFQNFLACVLPLGRGWFQAKNFFFGQKIFFSKIFRFFQIFFILSKISKFTKKFSCKFFLEKNLGKANLQLSERSEPRIPRVYRVPKAPSMRVCNKKCSASPQKTLNYSEIASPISLCNISMDS